MQLNLTTPTTSGDDPQLAQFEKWTTDNDIGGKELPMVTLPSDDVTISQCAAQLFKVIGSTKRLFVRGGVVMKLTARDDGLLALAILRPAAARSCFEKFAQ